MFRSGRCGAGPTLFSGLLAGAGTNAKDFRGGWFHLGYVRATDGTLDFVDRVKTHQPAEKTSIRNRRVLSHPQFADAVVVRKTTPNGEVPIAFVAATSTARQALACRQQLAGTTSNHFVNADFRSSTGKFNAMKWKNG